MPRPRGTSHYRLLDIEIAEIARHDLERFLRLRRVATLYLQALHALAELADAVLRFCDSLGDSEKSVRFYEDLLGFVMQVGASFNDNQLMADTAGAPGASFRQSRANVPGTNAPMTLIEFKNVPRTPLKGRVQDPGTAILQLRVRDVAALTSKLKAAGVPIVTTGGVPVDVGNLKISLVRGPDNLLLELMQRGN